MTIASSSDDARTDSLRAEHQGTPMKSAPGLEKSLSLPMRLLAGAVAMMTFASATAFIPATMEVPSPIIYAPAMRSVSLGTGGEGVVEIDGYIGIDGYWSWDQEEYVVEGKSSSTFGREIRALGAISVLRLKLNSPGGYTDNGTQIYNILMELKATGVKIIVELGAQCYSAATLIACAGDEIIAYANSIWMIHDPSGGVWGSLAQIKSYLQYMEVTKKSAMTIYRAKNPSISEQELDAQMNETVYLTASEAKAAGWIDTIRESTALPTTMAVDVAGEIVGRASPEARAIIEANRARMDGNNPPAQTVDQQIAALTTTVTSLREDITALATIVRTTNAAPAPAAPAAPANAQVVDLADPIVMILSDRAVLAGETVKKQFDKDVLAGATRAQLQASYLGAAVVAPAPTIINTGLTPPAQAPAGGAKMTGDDLKPGDYKAAKDAALAKARAAK